MNEDPGGDERGTGESWYDRLRKALKVEPATREDLVELLGEGHWRKVLTPEELAMLHGVLQVSQTQVRDVMVPRSQMVVLEHDAPREQVLQTIVDSGHSRFPVIGDDRDEVIGVLLAKDLLRHFVSSSDQPFTLSRWLRPATFIPESKRLNTLLKEFRVSRNHMAIVVDEYGGVSGLLTIEDVLEEIVGDIDDETDPQEVEYIQLQASGEFHVRALTRIEDFNEFFDAALDDQHYDTVGGLVMHELGHLPRKGEAVELGGFQFKVLQADRRRVHVVEVSPPGTAGAAAGAASS
jgi:magnesium and cobalt transporter